MKVRRWNVESLEPRQMLTGDVDLQVEVQTPTEPLYPGDVVSMVVRVHNAGDKDAESVRVQLADDNPNLVLEWQRVGAEGQGDIDEQLSIPSGDTVQYQLRGTVPREVVGDVVMRASATPGDTQSEATPGDNTATSVLSFPLRTQTPTYLGPHANCFDIGHVVGDRLFFVGTVSYDTKLCYASRAYASSGSFGGYLTVTDGTVEGTYVVKDIRTFGMLGPADAFLQPEFADLDGIVYFPADDGIHGRELWRSDGTESGTYMVKNILPDPAPCAHPEFGCEYNRGLGAEISFLTTMSDMVFFVAEDPVLGKELWVTDGTEDGTRVLADIAEGLRSAFASNSSQTSASLTVLDDTLFFVANDRTHGVELWRTDGTPEGTTIVRDINPEGSSRPTSLRVVAGRLLFRADDGNGMRTWATDGTPEGTQQIEGQRPPAFVKGPLSHEDGKYYYNDADTGERRLVSDSASWYLKHWKPGKMYVLGDQAIVFLEGRFGAGAQVVALDLETRDDAGDFSLGRPWVWTEQDGRMERDTPATVIFEHRLKDGPGDDLIVESESPVAPTHIEVLTDTGKFVSIGPPKKYDRFHLTDKWFWDLSTYSGPALTNVVRVHRGAGAWVSQSLRVRSQYQADLLLEAPRAISADRDFAWDLDMDGVEDRFGVSVALTRAELAEFGIERPGSYPVQVRMNERGVDTFFAGTITVPPPQRADYNQNGLVDLDDFLTLQDNFGQQHAGTDLDGDGVVSFVDFLQFRAAYEGA